MVPPCAESNQLVIIITNGELALGQNQNTVRRNVWSVMEAGQGRRYAVSLRKLGRRWRVLAVIGVALAVAMASIVSNGSAKGVMRARSLERAALAALAKPPAPAMPASGKVLGGLTHSIRRSC
jgi:hypothetical protein